MLYTIDTIAASERTAETVPHAGSDVKSKLTIVLVFTSGV